jgi:FtsP/CotA-like multicopper oxidase with cupredoxin domain
MLNKQNHMKNSIFLSRRSALLGLGVTLINTVAKAQVPVTPPQITLRAKSTQKRIKQNSTKDANIFEYSNAVLKIKKGDALNIRFENALPSPTSLHWYGVRGLNAMDGVAGLTQSPIKQDETFNYSFTPPDSGSFWYHPLVQGSAAEQLDRGLSGLLIIEEPDAPSVDQDIAVIIDDWRLSLEGEIINDFRSIIDSARGGRLGNFLTANSTPAPQKIEAKPNGRIRLRLLNATNARICPLKFDNIQAHVIAIDGQACDPFDPLRRTVIMAPGSRFDVIVDIPTNEGQRGEIGISLGNAVLPLLSIISNGQKVNQHAPLLRLVGNNLPPAIRLQNAIRKDLVITGGLPSLKQGEALPNEPTLKSLFPDPMRIWQINGGANNGFAGKPLFSVKSGTPIVINISNRTAWSQVIHVHGHNFRLLHAFDDGWEPYFLDTVFIAEGRSSLISFVADNVGKWAIRSSILDHFDSGLATWFEVT